MEEIEIGKEIGRKVREVVQKSRESRGRELTRAVIMGYRLDELVLVEYIGWPRIVNLGNRDGFAVFECKDRFNVVPKEAFDGSTTQRKSGLHQGLRMECNPYKAKEDPDETTSTFTV
jgi:hypothetical protein